MNHLHSSALQTLIRDALANHRQGRLIEAERIYRRALAIDARNADCLHLLGMVAFQSGKLEEASALIRQAIEIHKTAPSYYSNLGNVLQAQGRLQEAEGCYRHALELKPGQAEVCVNLGHVLKAQGDVNSALENYQSALAIVPELAEAEAAMAMALLLKGDFATGWQHFESRWRTQDYETPFRAYPLPQWLGEPLSGRLLIWGEQGIGDEIMFAGLLPDVLRAGHRCVLDCDPRLTPLFARSFPQVHVISGYDPVRDSYLDIAAHLPNGSLARLFRNSFESFASTTCPYLRADATLHSQFRSRYSDGRRIVGVAWHTRNTKSGPRRSIDLSRFASLFSLSAIQWVSLQYGDPDALQIQLEAVGAPVLVDRSVDQFSDVDRFAAQVAAMDLVITIDNSTAHLAAALGIPTWLLLPFAPDWRWLVAGDSSPWYPTMRIFRQPAPGDWKSVLLEVETALVRELNLL